MEGTVIDLGDHVVAKIWHRRTARELGTLRTFYNAVDRGHAAFATPTIHRILHLDGQFATVEALLLGEPLSIAADSGSPALDDSAIDAVTDVLGDLAAIEPTADMGILPILEGEAPFETQAVPFTRSLASLVERRVEKFRGPLSARWPTVEVAAACVGRRLNALEIGKSGLVHGDLIPANILVDDASRPLAVLDFGFMTTIGDPAFDAAITASIYDMYGPLAAKNEAILDELLPNDSATTRRDWTRTAPAMPSSRATASAPRAATDTSNGACACWRGTSSRSPRSLTDPHIRCPRRCAAGDLRQPMG